MNLSTRNTMENSKNKNSSFTVLTILIFIMAVGSAVYFYNKYKNIKNKPTDIEQTLTEQNKNLKESLGKLIMLDTTEEPTIATVKDIDTLKKENQEFYKDGKNGDILFIYTKKAILYDKDRNIIVNVAPVIVNPETPATVTPTPSINPTPTPKK